MLRQKPLSTQERIEDKIIKAFEEKLAGMTLDQIDQELKKLTPEFGELRDKLLALELRKEQITGPQKLTFWIVWNGACTEGFVTDDYAEALSIVGANDAQEHPSALGERLVELYDGETFTITQITLEDHRS